jgi:EAL domain-containing protein (putative c-di-GMP-specific phosphodiesterase class I)
VLLRRADIAMYAAKLIPGTAFLHYTPTMAQPGADQAGLGAELHQALERDQLFLVYQPIVALDSRRLLGAEALVRWAHPGHGTLSPQAFLPAAERSGLIVPLTHWVLRAALAQLAQWDATHGVTAPPMLNINISPRDLREPDFAQAVTDLLDEFGIDAGRITLEITESVPLEPAQAGAAVRRLRARGVRVALDDFGTGHSTLSTLHAVPVDQLKLDADFTQAAPTAEVPVAAAVHYLASSLGLNTIAEGVETPAQAAHLQDLGYDSAQGFYFAHPMPAEALTALLDGRSLMPAA